jgi:glycosyltransferase involved in cell wall biosynthesis
VRFLPRFVTDPELPAFFRRADVMVMPYRRIEASGVLFSALPFGVPILASAVGSFVDVAAAGGAETVPPGDAGALHDALVRLIGDPGRREQLRQGALRASAGPFSWDTVAAQTLAVYDTVRGRSS